MANRHKKKRQKKYSGADAKVTAPQVLRVSAEERSAFTEWRRSYAQHIKLGSVAFGVVAAIAMIIIGIIGLF